MISLPQVPAGQRDRFPTTRWSLIGDVRSGNPEALAELCRMYWYPLYCYARRSCGNRDDALDLTQGFFEMLTARESLNLASEERGRLRTFLLASMKNFAVGQYRRGQAEKRGGNAPVIALDGLEAEERYALEPCDHLSPDRAFDRAWAKQMLESALAELGNAYRSAGKGEVFEALRDHLLDGGTESYSAAAQAMNASPAAVRYAAFKLRERFRDLLREAIMETAANADEAREEEAYLRRILSE